MPGNSPLKSFAFSAFAITALVGASIGVARASDSSSAFLQRSVTSSTIPANGDLNPYGVAFVPDEFPAGGSIQAGDVLVSNFNSIANLQGTGTTIVKLTPNGVVAPPVAVGTAGNAATFFVSPLNGLSTALGVLRGGFVIVGNVPTTDGTIKTLTQGSLQIIDRHGNLVRTLNDAAFLDTPWDLTLNDEGAHAQLYVSNVLSGTVVRLDLAVSGSDVVVTRSTQIGAGYKHEPNAAALVLGPTGLAYDANADTLYVASTDDNAIYAIANARNAAAPVNKGRLVFASSALRGPLALALAPNGDLLTANGDAVNSDATHPSEIIEFTKSGQFVRQFDVDASQGGAFGIAIALDDDAKFNFAAIDDVPNVVTAVRVRR